MAPKKSCYQPSFFLIRRTLFLDEGLSKHADPKTGLDFRAIFVYNMGMDRILNSQKKRGQTLLEFVMILAVTLGLVVSLGFFMYVFKEHGGRILDLVSSEYP